MKVTLCDYCNTRITPGNQAISWVSEVTLLSGPDSSPRITTKLHFCENCQNRIKDEDVRLTFLKGMAEA